MHPRTNVLDSFSTFIQFADDRFELWASDRRLVQSMEKQLARATLRTDRLDQQEDFWSQYWHQVWQRSPSTDRIGAVRHLCAYLQEPCYWASENVSGRFETVHCTLADGFQLAIAHLERILKGYNPNYGSCLKIYARNAFGNVIRDQLRQSHDVNICSDWGLLRRLSQTQLKQSLLAAGFIDIKPTVLVWQCFKAICIPNPQRSVRRLSPPSADQLIQIAERYNQQRCQLSPVPPRIDTGTIVVKLTQSTKAARAYLAPTVVSLNQSQDEDGYEPLDALCLHTDATPIERLLTAEAYSERQQSWQQLANVLEEAILALDPPSQTLLTLYYQQTWTQQDIAEQLNLKQYQVSRKLNRIRQVLLLRMAQWSQETLHIDMGSTVLASVNEAIHEWLQQHYRPERSEVSE